MLQAFAKAVAQLSDPRIVRVLLMGAAATVILYVLVYAGLGWLIHSTALSQTAWLDSLLSWLGGLAVMILTLVFFPTVISLVVSFLLDPVIAAVEARHYPGLPPPRRQPAGEAVMGALRFVGVMVLINLLALPLYLFLPGVNLVLYFGINGYLLGRDYFEMVAARRLEPDAAAALRRRWMPRLWLAGVAIAVVAWVPVVNLVAPVLGAAFMVHVFQHLQSNGASA